MPSSVKTLYAEISFFEGRRMAWMRPHGGADGADRMAGHSHLAPAHHAHRTSLVHRAQIPRPQERFLATLGMTVGACRMARMGIHGDVGVCQMVRFIEC